MRKILARENFRFAQNDSMLSPPSASLLRRFLLGGQGIVPLVEVDHVLKDERLGERLVELAEDATIALDHVHQFVAGRRSGMNDGALSSTLRQPTRPLLVGVAGGDQVAFGIGPIALVDQSSGQ